MFFVFILYKLCFCSAYCLCSVCFSLELRPFNWDWFRLEADKFFERIVQEGNVNYYSRDIATRERCFEIMFRLNSLFNLFQTW